MKSYRLCMLLTLFFISASIVAMTADNSGANSENNSGIEVSSAPNTKGETRRWEMTGPFGGDVRALVASPDNANLLYLGTSDGQIFRSTDNARTWRRLKPGLNKRGLSVDDIVIDPRDTRTIYAGAWAVAQEKEEQGVYKSKDGGENWELLKGTKGLTMLSLAIAPSDSNTLVAGAKSGAFRTTDAGKNWERISPEGHAEIRNINSAAIDPQNTDIVYVGTHHLPWKTTDGGKTYNQTGYKAVGMIDDTDIMGICVNPSNPNLVYINGCSGIYRSSTSGEKWTKLPGIPFSARRTYALLPHPTKPEIIFAGTSEGLWRSKDGGKRWMLLTSKSVVIRSVVIHPSNPNRVLIATDDFGVRVSDNLGDDFLDANIGFIHRHILAILPDVNERGRILASVFHDGTAGSVFASSDGGENWQPSSRGLGSRDVYAFYQMPDNPNLIYAGTNTGVFRSTDRGASWAFAGQEQIKKAPPVKKPKRNVRRAGLQSEEDTTAVVASVSTRAVGRYETTNVQRRSSPKAKKPKPSTRKPIRKPAPKPIEPAGPVLIGLTKQVDDITSFIDSEGRRGLLAATMDGLYKTMDETVGWEKIPITGYDATGRVYSISTHRDNPGRILVGTKQGLFTSNDGGLTWEHVDRGPSDVIVKAIAQDPKDSNLILLGTNQFIFRSTNGGRTWVRRGGGLAAGDYTSVVINPTNPDEVMVAEYSRGGIYRSVDKGYSWERIDERLDADLPSRRVWTISFDPFDRDRAYAGSFSGGVYVLTIQRGASNGSQ